MITYGFYNSINHDRQYSAIQFTSIFDGIIRDGVFMSIGTCFRVVPSSGMTVLVGAGRAWFDHSWTLNDAPKPYTLPQSEVILDRIDAIVLDVDSRQESRKNDIIIIKGTPSSQPSRPALIHTENHNQYPLAYISVAAGSISIRAADITSMVGTSETPYVTGILETVNIDALLDQWSDQWLKWYEEYTVMMNGTADEWKTLWSTWYARFTQTNEHEFNSWSEEKKNEFNNWFVTIKNTLEDDAAGKLATELLKLSDRLDTTGMELSDKIATNKMDIDSLKNQNWSNADMVDGFHADKGSTPNTCVVRDDNGFINVKYINSETENNENITANQVVVTNGTDSYYRKIGIDTLKQQMNLDRVNNTPDSEKTVATADNANSIGGLKLDIATENTEDTWLLVVGDGVIQHRMANDLKYYYPITGGDLKGDLSFGEYHRINLRKQSLLEEDGYRTEAWIDANSYDLNLAIRKVEVPAAANRESWINLRSTYVNVRDYDNTTFHPIIAGRFDQPSGWGDFNDPHDMTEEEARLILDLDIYYGSYKSNVNQYQSSGFINWQNVPVGSKMHLIVNSSRGCIDYTKLVPFLVKMVQLQQKEIDQLKEEVNNLKGENS